MFNMIIVDDEPLIIESLSLALKEIQSGFNLVASFTNPMKALNYIRDNTVHLVITDIKMPQMTGIDLAKEISQNYPKTKIMFLTAYSEIEYAQQAIKYNAEAYLLKPIDMSEFTESLEKIKKSLVNSGNAIDYHSDANLLSGFDILSARKILAKFLSNSLIDCKEVYDGLKKCGMNITEKSPCALAKLHLYDLDTYLHTVWIHGLLRLYDAIDKCYASDDLYIIPTTFSFDTVDLFILSKSDNIDFFNAVSNFMDVTVTTCADILNLNVQLDITKTADSILKFNPKINTSPITDANSLFDSIVNHTSYSFPKYYGQNFDDTLLFGRLLVFNFSEHCNDFINTISPMLGMLSEAASNNDLTEAISDIIKEITIFFNNKKTYNEKITQACIDYINLHYGENISLNKISNELNISTSQLSKIFKKTLNVKYVDYLNTVRLEKAKAMLKDSTLNIKTISYLVGYASYPYFLRIFKGYTGKTPQEYRAATNK